MKKNDFDELLASVKQGANILKGKIKATRTYKIDNPDVQELRKRLKLSQSQFARWMGISVGTLRNWEQNRRQPHGSARVLLGVVALHPEVLPDVVMT